jgi:hypothetical protein
MAIGTTIFFTFFSTLFSVRLFCSMIIFEMPQASSDLMEVAALALALPEGAKGAGLTKKPDDKKAGKEEKKKK